MAHNLGTDGAIDRVLRFGQAQKTKHVPAIFIHAGAGFHSKQNERVHLEACVAAAEMGMRFLKAGSTATEAIEAALRVLEDKEITNAGYGSNLSIDGTVECDATIVDHLGRSGACGAVPNIRNPISLAKLILDTSNHPLSLRRVPPNALVGDGARAFAEEHGMATFSNDYLVSKSARDRFLRWQEDLKRADVKISEASTGVLPAGPDLSCIPCQYDTTSSANIQHATPRDYRAALLAGTWNEGQPDSPYCGTPSSDTSSTEPSAYFRNRPSTNAALDISPLRSSSDCKPIPSNASMTGKDTLVGNNQATAKNSKGRDMRRTTQKDGSKPTLDTPGAFPDGSISAICQQGQGAVEGNNKRVVSTAPLRSTENRQTVKRPHTSTQEVLATNHRPKRQRAAPEGSNGDAITDTIGAIAIDEMGHIAAGSSSGGIGMKHRGRLGPAALVGVGTAVVPHREDDDEGVTVAAVTSGTGEHMATTTASQRCAERIYHGIRLGPRGAIVQDDDEDAIMESFIADDFMNHPGVKSCHSAGAIGVMAVKKTHSGYYLYFAHNTDSFALASMGGLEKEARCTMSRLPDGAKIAKGGRKVRLA
ncbi:Threonine aspartase 1 [Paramyrothecium foliicola]|nr:Threonine aspartase 1 [Paramyrothecium foliicola]